MHKRIRTTTSQTVSTSKRELPLCIIVTFESLKTEVSWCLDIIYAKLLSSLLIFVFKFLEIPCSLFHKFCLTSGKSFQWSTVFVSTSPNCNAISFYSFNDPSTYDSSFTLNSFVSRIKTFAASSGDFMLFIF